MVIVSVKKFICCLATVVLLANIFQSWKLWQNVQFGSWNVYVHTYIVVEHCMSLKLHVRINFVCIEGLSHEVYRAYCEGSSTLAGIVWSFGPNTSVDSLWAFCVDRMPVWVRTVRAFLTLTTPFCPVPTVPHAATAHSPRCHYAHASAIVLVYARVVYVFFQDHAYWCSNVYMYC